MKINNLKTHFSEFIPKDLEDGVLYISEEYGSSLHLCPCGCKELISLPMNSGGQNIFWDYSRKGELVSFTPSVGNWQLPCKSHYFITNNNIIWC